MLVLLDHGQGNIGSLSNTLEYLGLQHKVCSHAKDIGAIGTKSGFILPGVGAFNIGMQEMKKRKLDKVVRDMVEKGVKGMGICLGMQMLCHSSEEGNFEELGIGIFKGKIMRMDEKNDVVPNIGWNVTNANTFTGLNINVEKKLTGTFYYLHSYAYKSDDKESKEVAATFKHGEEEIVAAIYSNNVLGVQFHPEKSQISGLSLIDAYFKGN